MVFVIACFAPIMVHAPECERMEWGVGQRDGDVMQRSIWNSNLVIDEFHGSEVSYLVDFATKVRQLWEAQQPGHTDDFRQAAATSLLAIEREFPSWLNVDFLANFPTTLDVPIMLPAVVNNVGIAMQSWVASQHQMFIDARLKCTREFIPFYIGENNFLLSYSDDMSTEIRVRNLAELLKSHPLDEDAHNDVASVLSAFKRFQKIHEEQNIETTMKTLQAEMDKNIMEQKSLWRENREQALQLRDELSDEPEVRGGITRQVEVCFHIITTELIKRPLTAWAREHKVVLGTYLVPFLRLLRSATKHMGQIRRSMTRMRLNVDSWLSVLDTDYVSRANMAFAVAIDKLATEPTARLVADTWFSKWQKELQASTKELASHWLIQLQGMHYRWDTYRQNGAEMVPEIFEVVQRLRNHPMAAELPYDDRVDFETLRIYLDNIEKEGSHLTGLSYVVSRTSSTEWSRIMPPEQIADQLIYNEIPRVAYDVGRKVGDKGLYVFHDHDRELLLIYDSRAELPMSLDIPFDKDPAPWMLTLESITNSDENVGKWFGNLRWIARHKNPEEWLGVVRKLIATPLLRNSVDWCKKCLRVYGTHKYTNIEAVKGAIAYMEQVVPRVRGDRQRLINAELISDEHVLSSVEFSNSDFHKKWKSVLFLNFQAPSGASDQRIIYKPSSLKLDAALVGVENSLAHLLDPHGEVIPQYKIVPMKNDILDSYGYMEFVSPVAPATLVDLEGVALSIGAATAFSYVVGIEDMHRGNMIFRRNKLQLIDVETTTGIFTGHGFHQNGWSDALEDLKYEEWVIKLAPENADLSQISQRLTKFATISFKKVLRAVAQLGEFAQDWDRVVADLATARGRFLPMHTSDFMEYFAAAQAKTFTQWKSHISRSTMKLVYPPQKILQKYILSAEETYNALRRGDIPFFWNDLESTTVRDEKGNSLEVGGILPDKTVRRPIQVEISERIAHIRAVGVENTDGFTEFEHTVIPLLEGEDLEDSDFLSSSDYSSSLSIP